MHGAFSYQLKQAPAHIPRHNESDYLGIVKYFINIGHVHGFSTYGRILAQGSFDRTAHNEEHPKGGIVCDIRGPDGDSWFFVENKGAKIFKTIELKNPDLDKSISKIHKSIKDLPDDSHIRIKAVKAHPVYVALDEIKLRYPAFNFTRVVLDETTEEATKAISLPLASEFYKSVSITNDNIVSLLMHEVKSKYSLTDAKLAFLNSILEETCNG